LSVPVPEFHTSKAWLDAFDPFTHETVNDDGVCEIAGVLVVLAAYTIKLTGIVCGVFVAPGALIVIVVEYPPGVRFEAAKLTVMVV
jgi:hypothetical protein